MALIVGLLVGIPGAPAGAEQTRHCDRTLAARTSAENPYRYQELEGRCEGVYRVGRSGRSSRAYLAGFMAAPYRLDTARPSGLLLSWSSPPDQAVHLQAFSLQPPHDDDYRMDSRRRPGERSFLWPLDIVHRLRMEVQHLGVLAWVETDILGASQKLYLPVHVNPAQPPRPPLRPVFAFAPTGEIEDFSYRVLQVDARDDFGPRHTVEGPVRPRGRAPISRPFTFRLRAALGPGRYVLWSSWSADGRPVKATETWFLIHP